MSDPSVLEQQIGDALRTAGYVRTTHGSRELSLVVTKLEEAEMWAARDRQRADADYERRAAGGKASP